MYKLRNKRNHGITLIALVITVKNSYVKGNKKHLLVDEGDKNRFK